MRLSLWDGSAAIRQPAFLVNSSGGEAVVVGLQVLTAILGFLGPTRLRWVDYYKIFMFLCIISGIGGAEVVKV
jgi:hypothetical protein